ncbi:MAG: crAss001_48 related protein [Pseudomonas sp.]
MSPHQQRVVEEKAELDGRIERLASFLRSERAFTVEQMEALRERQLDLMEQLSELLGDRIANFSV